MTCESGRVHLIGGETLSKGRVEYCYDSSWYSVCASDLDKEGARVVCNTLGYDTTDGNGSHTISVNICFALFNGLYLHHSVQVVANFGRGTSPILPQSIQCTRDDRILSDCSMKDQNSPCLTQHVAGVICEGL